MNSNSPGELGGPTGPKAGRGALALTGLAALGIVALLVILMPWMLRTLIEFTTAVIQKMPQMVQ